MNCLIVGQHGFFKIHLPTHLAINADRKGCFDKGFVHKSEHEKVFGYTGVLS